MLVMTVLIALHSQLRPRRRQVLTELAVLAVALAALTAHSALMGSMGDHAMSDTAAICLALGGSLAIAGATVFAIGRLAQRPPGVIPVPAAPALAFVPTSTGFVARAGPPPMLQVFRL